MFEFIRPLTIAVLLFLVAIVVAIIIEPFVWPEKQSNAALSRIDVYFDRIPDYTIMVSETRSTDTQDPHVVIHLYALEKTQSPISITLDQDPKHNREWIFVRRNPRQSTVYFNPQTRVMAISGVFTGTEETPLLSREEMEFALQKVHEALQHYETHKRTQGAEQL